MLDLRRLVGNRLFRWLLVAAVVAATAAILYPRLRWRAQLFAMKARGELIAMEWREVFGTMLGNDRYSIHLLLATGNPHRAIFNPHRSEEDARAGAELFRTHCASCHGADGRGATAPDLGRAHSAHGALSLFRVVSEGLPGTAMAGFDLPEASIWRLVAFVESLRDSAHAPAATALAAPRVTYDRLQHPEREPGNWLTYSGNYRAHRHSPLDQIDHRNVRALELRWLYQLATIEGRVETTPLVVDGVMYLTEPPNNVIALNAATGEPLWQYRRDLPERIPLCCGRVNRGLALLGDRLYLGTLDAHLVALDATTGAVLWDVEVADYRLGYSITGAPLAIKNKVVVGVAGGEYGVRGFLDAYEADSGARSWRFYTAPAPGELGNETWEGDSWKTGGAPTWLTGSFDPTLNLVYWGVGNPGPPWDGDERAGDNLYSNSVIALDAEAGTLRWHFQFTPHDEHDWDATQMPVLVDERPDGLAGEWMLFANRNGFYYVLDRATGKFLTARAFVKQTWAEGLDSSGRPIRRPDQSPTPHGTLVFPSAEGATNWWSPSYSPSTQLFYVPAVMNSASVYYKGWSTQRTYRAGEPFYGSAFQPPAAEPLRSAILALVPRSGEVRWEYAFPPRRGETYYRGMGGVLSTGGRLVFAGDGDVFVALDALSGSEVWSFRTGGQITAAPISYLSGERQQVTVAAGRTIFTFAIPQAALRDSRAVR